MLRRARLLMTVAALVAVAAIGAGCGGDDGDDASSGGKAKLTFWHGQTELWADCLKKQIAEFNRTHKNIEVSSDTGGVVADRMLQKVTAGLQAGNYPDVAYVFGSDLANFAKSDKLLDLSDSDEIDIDRFYPAGREAATVDGKVRAVPALIDNLAVVYNTKLFKAAGVPPPDDDWTWDDFRATAKRLTDKDKGIVGTGWPGTGDEDTTWRIWPLIWQLGGDVLSEDGKSVGFDGDSGERALSYVRDLAADGSVYIDTTAGSERMNQLFQSNKMAMLPTGPWNLPDFVDAGVDYGVVQLPAFTGEHETIAGPDVWAIFDNGKQRSKAAQVFVGWLTSPEQILACAEQAGSLPTREDVTKLPGYEDYVESLPHLDKFVANLENAQVRPTIAGYPEISKSMGKAIGLMLFRKGEPASALADAVEQSNAKLRVPGR
jgi:multiple sugar transport system substrate-binding protein